MLRLSHALWFVLPAGLLSGCPMYPDACDRDSDCGLSYQCDYPSGRCVPIQYGTPPGPPRCHTTSDCDAGLVCDRYLRCVEPGGEAGASGAAGRAGQAGAAG